MANQGHGFKIERAILSGPFQIPEEKHETYTSIFDLPCAENRFNNCENISVKAMRGDSCGLGDALRIFNYKEHDCVTLIVVNHMQQSGSLKKITGVTEISMGGSQVHKMLFNEVTQAEVQKLNDMIKAVPAGVSRTHASRVAVHAYKKELNAKSGLISFNPKMDSKNQRRLQCSMKLSQIRAKHPEMILSSCTEAVVRGTPIPPTVCSGPRKRSKGSRTE